MPAYWWWTTGALELQEHTANPWGAAPAHTHVAVPTAAPRLPLLRFLSHSSELWTRSSAIVIQLPQSAMIHSPVKRLQLLAPACLVVSSPTKQGLQHLWERDIRLALLSLGSMHWILFSGQQRIPLEGNVQACLLFSFTVHSPNKAFLPFTSPFVLAQGWQVAILGWIHQCRHFLKRQRLCNSQKSFLTSICFGSAWTDQPQCVHWYQTATWNLKHTSSKAILFPYFSLTTGKNKCSASFLFFHNKNHVSVRDFH